MEGKIDLLNVGDGDAIIIQLKKNNDSLLIVVDGGRLWDYESIVKPKLVSILKELNKKAPDIVIATHYDSDHIGGLIPLVQDYVDDIKEVWIHKSPEITATEKVLTKNKPKDIKTLSQFLFENSLIKNSKISEESLRKKSELVIESIRELRKLLEIIPDNKIKEVFHGYSYRNWPELKVLGPTEEYYNSLFPENLSLKELILEETIDYEPESTIQLRNENLEHFKLEENPCNYLKDDETVRLTPTNKASIIFRIDKEKKRFLFTGDAGISSFKAIPNWENELKDIYWLKVPHHGSNNNISSEIINVMRPQYSDNTGDKYQDNPVLQCISRNSRSKSDTRSTKLLGNLEFEI